MIDKPESAREFQSTQGDPLPSAKVPAGFWVRLGAISVDLGLVYFSLEFVRTIAASIGAQWFYDERILFSVAAVYFAVATSLRGQTFGKRFAGLVVVRKDNVAAGVARSCLRTAAYVISAVPLFLGFIAVAFTLDRRALHDYVSGTKVVHSGQAARWRSVTSVVFGVLAVLLLPVMAIPNPTRVIERSRFSEATQFISQVKDMQAQFATRHGRHANSLADLGRLPELRDYRPTLVPGKAKCSEKKLDGYSLVMERIGAPIPRRYGKTFHVVYDRCADTVFIPDCSTCEKDFLDR